MRKILIATRNKGKFVTIKRAFKNFPFKVLNLNDVKKIPKKFEVQETGKSFEENAVLKAKIFAEMSDFLTLADDSGLEVDALNGQPGIYSSRYGKGTDKDKCLKLLQVMKNVPREKRGAQFCSFIAIFDPQTEEMFTFKGTCEGEISRKARGKYGFGYDPIFFLPQLGKTVAQLKPEEKDKISHRGKALKKARKVLKKFL